MFVSAAFSGEKIGGSPSAGITEPRGFSFFPCYLSPIVGK